MKLIFGLLVMALSLLAYCESSTALVVCGTHGTNGGGDAPPQQCMKVRPLQDRVLTVIPMPTCPQIDPPGWSTTRGGSRDHHEESTRGGGTRHHLPKKRFVGGLSYTDNAPFFLEMDVNSVTKVWWEHAQEQEEGCRRPATEKPESKRLVRVDILVVDEDNYNCDDYNRDQENDSEDENRVMSVGQRVHILL